MLHYTTQNEARFEPHCTILYHALDSNGLCTVRCSVLFSVMTYAQTSAATTTYRPPDICLTYTRHMPDICPTPPHKRGGGGGWVEAAAAAAATLGEAAARRAKKPHQHFVRRALLRAIAHQSTIAAHIHGCSNNMGRLKRQTDNYSVPRTSTSKQTLKNNNDKA